MEEYFHRNLKQIYIFWRFYIEKGKVKKKFEEKISLLKKKYQSRVDLFILAQSYTVREVYKVEKVPKLSFKNFSFLRNRGKIIPNWFKKIIFPGFLFLATNSPLRMTVAEGIFTCIDSTSSPVNYGSKMSLIKCLKIIGVKVIIF